MLNPCSAPSSVGAWDSRHSRRCRSNVSPCLLASAWPVRAPWATRRACQASLRLGRSSTAAQLGCTGFASRRNVLMQSNSVAVSSSSTQASSVPSRVSKADHVFYRFVVPEYVTHFGEYLKVVGSLPEMGSWDLGAAPAMTWQPGHKWLLEVKLPRSTFEFKVVALQGNGVRWEQGINRVVQAEDGTMDVPVELVINVHCAFGLTAQTGMELVLDRKSVQESYELATATLELLQQRRAKLQKQLQKGAKGRAPTPEQEEEAARLDAALSQQQRSLADLGALVSTARLSDDGDALLLQLEGSKVQVPDPVSFLAKGPAASVSLALQAADVTLESTPLPASSSHASTNGRAAEANGHGVPQTQPTAARAVPAKDEGKRVAAAGGDSTTAQAAASLSQVVGQVQEEWGTESMGTPAVEAYLQGDSSALDTLESDHDLEPDDAAAAMAAAAFAVLPNSSHSKRKHKRKRTKDQPASATQEADDEAEEQPALEVPRAETKAEQQQQQQQQLAKASAMPKAGPDYGLWPGLEQEAPKKEHRTDPEAKAPTRVVPDGPGSNLAAITAASADDDMVAAVAAAVATEEAAAAAAALNGAPSFNMTAETSPDLSFTQPPESSQTSTPASASEPEPAPALLEVITAAAVTAAIADQRRDITEAILSEPQASTEAAAAAPEPVTERVQAAASAPVTSKVEAAVAAAAAASEEVAAELVAAKEAAEHHGSLSKMLADIDISSLPAPKPVAGGALFFSNEVLSSFKLVKKPAPPRPKTAPVKQRRRIEAVP